jgi:cytochrome c5
VSDELPAETTEVPSQAALDSAAVADSIAQAQAVADSIAAAEAATTAATPSSSSGSSTPAAGAAGTIWEGVYTTAQANTGREVYNDVCSLCHTLDQWQDPGVLTRHGNTLGGLFGFISDQMPQSEPGSLFPEDYAAVVAYMLSMNGVPAGNRELPTTYAAMDRIRVTPRP